MSMRACEAGTHVVKRNPSAKTTTKKIRAMYGSAVIGITGENAGKEACKDYGSAKSNLQHLSQPVIR